MSAMELAATGARAPAQALRVFFVVGESSGDRLGAALMRGLRAEHGGGLAFQGVGGAAMAAEGLESRFPIAEIAVMGLTEVLPRLPTILRRIRETADAIVADPPDLVITIDAPDFGLRVAKAARRALSAAGSARTMFVHYVAPTVWAWRPKRAQKIATRVDHLLALLPFEPPYFHRVGLSCDFVGHPIVETVATIDPEDRSFRAEIGVAEDAPLLVALPGSRRGEVTALGEAFGETIGLLAAKRPGLRVVLPAAENVVDLVTAQVAQWPAPTTLLDPRELSFPDAERRKFRAMAAADVALAASGTVSLELAAMRTPMAIAYRSNPITAEIVRRMVLIDTATLVNLVSETRAVPEFLQEKLRPAPMADMLDRLFEPDAPERQAQLEAAATTMARLGQGDAPPSRRAARSVLNAVARRAARAT